MCDCKTIIIYANEDITKITLTPEWGGKGLYKELANANTAEQKIIRCIQIDEASDWPFASGSLLPSFAYKQINSSNYDRQIKRQFAWPVRQQFA